MYLEICNLISCQIDKVTKSFEILSENDVETVLNEILKTMYSNFEKIPPILNINSYVIKSRNKYF